ncbi:hypothetical protein [Novosphingobium sp. TH158]|nr:hypothetical protein [Novosphingobium sp. TH158]
MLVLLFHYTWKAPEIYPAAHPVGIGLSWGGFGVELFFAAS